MTHYSVNKIEKYRQHYETSTHKPLHGKGKSHYSKSGLRYICAPDMTLIIMLLNS